MNIRATTVGIIVEVAQQEKSLTYCLEKQSQHSALLQELCFGTLRWYDRLNAISKQLLEKPLAKKNFDIHMLLLVGLYQVIYMDLPNYAVVNETVKTCTLLKKTWAKSLINASLRNFLKNETTILQRVDKKPQQKFSHPTWLYQAIKKNWPTEWQAILNANNQKPQLTLRINQQKTNADQFSKLLSSHKIAFERPNYLPHAFIITNSMQPSELPGFNEGLFYIQDIAGQFTPTILAPKENQIILDACAAPGSKTTHLLETEPNITKITTIDKSNTRLLKLKENVQRLQLPSHLIHLILGDANQTESWWDGKLFDKILLDAPCSATGVIRRHPDIKRLRKAEDIAAYPQQQISLLRSLWPLLKPGGTLLYSTCSILPDENELVVKRFCQEQDNINQVPLLLAIGLKKAFGWQILPSNQNDGFFYVKLMKTMR